MSSLSTRRIRIGLSALLLVCLVAGFSIDYTVKKGDTLTKIAKEHGVSLSSLIASNRIPNPDPIHPGQKIVIPGKGGQPAAVYTVAPGDTLTRIASRHGTSALELAKANDLSNPNLIHPGQKLAIPGGASGAGGGSSAVTAAFHIVRSGESLSSIAAQYPGVTAPQIAAANGIINNVIYATTRLFLDGSTFVAAGTAGSTAYTVVKGDRLGDIAAKYGTTISAIAKASKITNVNLIKAGQTLTIPTGSSWVCPVASSSFFNDWGFPRSGGRYHEGNDLFAPRGTPVRASVSGRVEIITGTLTGLGYRLHGDDGVRYSGAHLDSLVKDGKVSAGDVIGYVGDTGNAKGTRPHLHFEIHPKDGPAVNPYPTLVHHGC